MNGGDANNCSINRDFNSGSCFTLEELHQIAKDYNDKYPKDNIKLYPSKSEMLSVLNEKLKQFCPDQTCWATLKFLKNNEDLKMAFKTPGPGGQFEWLSTTEINDYMERLMKLYKDFLFVGAVPIDIEDLDEFGVRSLNYDKLVKKIGKTKIGIIYNLDEHYKSGSHWVAFYIDFINKRIYYSDSSGKPPELRVRRLVKKITEKFYFDDTGKKMSLPVNSYMNDTPNALEQKYDIRWNKLQHQFGGSECGIYSINFITRILRGDTFDEIHKSRIKDQEINVCRKTYFSGYDKKIKGEDVAHIC